MGFFADYGEYVNDNPQGLWFKRRWYGWGWVPVRWQGFASIILFIGALVANAVLFERSIPAGTEPSSSDLAVFLGIEAVLVAVLIGICFWKGEKPRWSWGKPEDN